MPLACLRDTRPWRANIDGGTAILIGVSSLGAATGIYFFNDKLERMLNQERLAPLRWLAWGFAILGAVIILAGLIALL